MTRGLASDIYDVIVAGGGISGTMAAIAAAREGANTLLIERYTALGGMATLGLVQPITTWGLRGAFVIGGTGRALLEKMIERHPYAATSMSIYGPTCDSEYLKRELEQAALDHGVSLLYHTWAVDAVTEAERIASIRAVSKAGESLLSAGVFIDATGDGDIAARAGVPFDTDSQGITLMFVLAGVNRDEVPERERIVEIYEHAGPVSYRTICLFWGPRPDGVYVNMTEVEGLDALDPHDLTHATVTCRRQAWEILEIFREHVPGFENAYIAKTASALGVRESRHIRGLHTLSSDDVQSGRDFEDTIARAGCPVDIHGSDNDGLGQYRGLGRSYGVPYRALVTPEFANLIVTGRCISADQVAHSSVRRMAPGFALGEAAGIAAAQSIGHGDVRTLPIDPLQSALRGYGAIIDPE